MALTAKFSSVASRALLLTLSCLLAWTTHFGAASAQSQPRQQAGANPPVQNTIKTLAVVNGQPISRHQIAEECMRRFGQDVLDSRIKKLLVLDQCKKSGIVITEKDVNDELVGKAKSFGMSADKYVEMIVERRKISIDRLKNDIIWHELAIRRLASQNIQVTQQDLDKQMEFEFGAKVQVRQIVVDSQEKAEQIRGQLLAQPGNFERYAKQFSLDTQSSSMGGLLQPIRRNQGLPEFENVAFALQPNEISKVIPVANHFIVLRCEQIFPPTDLSPQEITYQQERMANEIKEKKLIESARAMFTVMQKNAKIVNVMNDPQLRKQMPGVAALVNGIKILDREVSEDCITRFGIQTTDTEINRTLLMQALKLANLQVSQEDITSEITRAAGALGHLKADGSPDVDNWLIVQTNNDLSKVDLYIEDQVWPSVALKKLVESTVTVSQQDLDKGFEANFGPRVEVLVCVSNNHRSALKVWNLASANATSDYFGELAFQYSIEPASKNNHGQVPPIRKHGGRPELEKEAFSLRAGELSKVVQVGDYWITMFCLGRTDPVVTDFDAVREELQIDILEKKMNIAMGEKFRQLRAGAQIDNFLLGTSQPGRDAVRSARATSQQQSNTPFTGQRR